MENDDEVQDLRRQRLQDWIDTYHDSNVTGFAHWIGKGQNQLAEMLSDRRKKSFGEKVARDIERRVAEKADEDPDALEMPPGYLVNPMLTLREHHFLRAYRDASDAMQAAAERVLGMKPLPEGSPSKKSPAPKGLGQRTYLPKRLA